MTTYPLSHQASLTISNATVFNLLCLAFGISGTYLITKGIDTNDKADKKIQQYKTITGIGMVALSVVLLLPPLQNCVWKKG